MTSELIENLTSSEELVYKDYRVSTEFKDTLLSDLNAILIHFGKEHIYDHLSYCLHELIDNSAKANIKRIYFREKQLDIHVAEQYEQGMQQFKEEILTDREHYLEQLEPEDSWVSVSYQYLGEELILKVMNNTGILPSELKKIHARIDKARIYETLAEIFEDISDDSESAGLGIVMLCMIIRKLGVPENSFRVESDSNITTVSITLPLSCVSDEESETISDSLITAINTIPQFPEHIIQLKQLLSTATFKQEEVLAIIKKDPALTAEILRMCNSAFYRRRNKIENTQMAISILGMRGLNSILDSWGARKALESQYSKELLEPLWHHSSQVAYITSILSKRYECSAQITELTYNSALLHEIGRIVLQGNHGETYREMEKICTRKQIAVDSVENLIQGVNHTILGAKLAEKWGLPDAIVITIRYYKLPLSSPEHLQQTAKIVYLAHIISNLLKNDNSDYQTENLPKYFGFSMKDTLSSLTNKVREIIECDEVA